MASIIKADTLQSTTANVFILNSSGTEYARFNSTGVFQLANPITFPAGTAAAPSITATGDTNTGLYFPAADTIGFVEGGAEVARFDSSGNLGIGTSSPAARLQSTKAGAEVARFTNSQSNGGDWEFKIGGGGFEDRKFMLTDKFSGADNVRTFVDSSGNFAFNSGYGSAAIAYGCRAWVNFNGTGTVAIRASGNVSSITDNGTGDYTVNFTTAMSDVNYVASLCTTEYASTNNVVYPTITGTTSSGATLQSTTQLRFNTASLGSPSTKYDMALICVSIFR